MSHHEQQPPAALAGAFDLQQLRGLQVSQEVYERMVGDALRHAGVVCVCGARIRNHGVQVLGVSERVQQVPTPNGPQPAVTVSGHIFCSRDCDAFTARMAREGEGWEDLPPASVVRDIGPIEWMDEDDG